MSLQETLMALQADAEAAAAAHKSEVDAAQEVAQLLEQRLAQLAAEKDAELAAAQVRE